VGKMIKIIAEAGCNWRTFDEAFDFIYQSKRLGLFATKFQIFNKELIKDNQNFLKLQDLILDKEDVAELFYYGQEIDQEVFFTPMYPEAVDWLEELQIPYYKLRYLDRWNMELTTKILETNKPLFISFNYNESIYLENIHKNIIPLFCIPEYPAKIDFFPFSIRYGFNDHYKGISNHNGLELLKICLEHQRYEYHECHVMLDGTEPLENDWSVSFSELKEVLK